MDLSMIILVGKEYICNYLKAPSSQEIVERYKKYYVSYYGGNPDHHYPLSSSYSVVPLKRAYHRLKMELLLEEIENLFGDCIYTTNSVSGNVYPDWPEVTRLNICKFLCITKHQLDLIVTEDKDAFLHISCERLSLALYLVSGTMECESPYQN